MDRYRIEIPVFNWQDARSSVSRSRDTTARRKWIF
jgi:hypothetical protein